MNINRFSFVKFNAVNNDTASKNLNVEKKASNAKKVGEKYTTQALGEEGGNRVIKDNQSLSPKIYEENIKNQKEAESEGTPAPNVYLDSAQYEGKKIQGTPGPNIEGNVKRVKIDASNRELPTIDFDYTGYVKISKHIPKFNPKETTTMALGEEGGSKYPNLSEY